MILVTFALPFEGRDFEKTLKGNSASTDTEILYIGVGAERAEKSLRRFLDGRQIMPSLIIAAGFGGGLDPALRRGDVIVDVPKEPKAASSQIGAICAQFASKIRHGPIRSANLIVDEVAAREGFMAESQAIVVDMETDTIRKVASERQIPVVGIRIITDSVHEPLPVPPEVLFDIGTESVPISRLLGHLLRHPQKMAGMVKFGRDSKKAAVNLGRLLEVLMDGVNG